jgi:phenylalanyl-tRNA synthetase beta subunit
MLEATEYDFTLMPLSIFSKDDNSDKNISFRVTLTSHNHTLTTDEVSRVVDSLAINAEKELQAQRI